MLTQSQEESKSTPQVSVIMNCFNSDKYLKDAIDSVYSQTYRDWEIIFWDNASTDKSHDIAKSYDFKLRYFKSEQTIDLGKARNLAIHKARGKYIAFLDCDDTWMPQKLAKQLPIFKDNPRVGLVFSNANVFFEEYSKSINAFSFMNIKPPRGKTFSYHLTKYAFVLPTVVLRLEALLSQPEWFDERFHFSEDYDLFLRIAYHWECDFVNEPLATYRFRSSSFGQSISGQYEGKERALTLEKFCVTYPGFADRYNKELSFNKRVIAMQQGKYYWRQGKKKEARLEFRKYISSPKMLLVYIATPFPYGLIMRIWDHWLMYRARYINSQYFK